MAFPSQKLDADNQRNTEGLPDGLAATAEPVSGHNIATVNAGTAPGTPQHAHVDQRRYSNEHLPWLMVSAILGAIGTTMSVVLLLLAMFIGPRYLEALAESKSAHALEVAESARSDARVAKDYVDQQTSKAKALEGKPK